MVAAISHHFAGNAGNGSALAAVVCPGRSGSIGPLCIATLKHDVIQLSNLGSSHVVHAVNGDIDLFGFIAAVIGYVESINQGLVTAVGHHFTGNAGNGSAIAAVVCPGRSGSIGPGSVTSFKHNVIQLSDHRRSLVVHAGYPYNNLFCVITAVIGYIKGIINVLVAAIGHHFAGNAGNGSAIAAIVCPRRGGSIRPGSVASFKHDVIKLSNNGCFIIVRNGEGSRIHNILFTGAGYCPGHCYFTAASIRCNRVQRIYA